MNLFDTIKEKYLKDVELELVDPNEIQQSILLNLWKDDFIEVDGVMVNIYSPEVKLIQILNFFKERMPWMKLQIYNMEQLEKNPKDVVVVKYACFNQLAGLLAEAHTNWANAGKPERIVLREKNNVVVTTH